MEQANRQSEIARETLGIEVDADVRRCTRCRRPARDDSEECDHHHELAKARKRRWAKKQRSRWRRQKLCTRCGGKRAPGSTWGCAGCLADLGRLKAAVVDRHVDRPRDRAAGFDARLEQSPDGKLRARRRFHGRAKRGRQSIAQLDEQDITDARRCVDHGIEALAYFRTDVVQSMPKAQREDVRAVALAKFRQAQRWLDEVIHRNDPKSRKAEERSEDD